MKVELSVLHGRLPLSSFALRKLGDIRFDKFLVIEAGEKAKFDVSRSSAAAGDL